MVALHCFWEERERVRSLPLSCIFCSQGCPIERFILVVVRIAAILNHKKPLPPRLRPSLIYAPFFFRFSILWARLFLESSLPSFFGQPVGRFYLDLLGLFFYYFFLFPRLSLLTHLLLLLLSSLTCVIYYSSCFTYSLEGGSTVTHSPAPSLHPLKYFHPLL